MDNRQGRRSALLIKIVSMQALDNETVLNAISVHRADGKRGSELPKSNARGRNRRCTTNIGMILHRTVDQSGATEAVRVIGETAVRQSTLNLRPCRGNVNTFRRAHLNAWSAWREDTLHNHRGLALRTYQDSCFTVAVIDGSEWAMTCFSDFADICQKARRGKLEEVSVVC